MDWHTRSQRQVGAEGVEAVRHWLYGGEPDGRRRQQPPVHAISIGVLLITLVATLVVTPGRHPAAAAPLPPGDYQVSLQAGDVWIAVGPDGSATVAADDGLVAVLSFDAAGRTLDRFSVASPAGLHRVEIEVAGDGDHHVVASLVDPSGSRHAAPNGDLTSNPSAHAAAASSHREAVLVVAACAPRGRQARASGWPTHGTVVSRVASGLPVSAAITDPATEVTTRVETRVTTVEDAVAFCSLVADLTTSVPPAAGSNDPQPGRDVPAADGDPSQGQGRPAAPSGHGQPPSDPGPPSDAGQGGATEQSRPGPPEHTTGRAATDGGGTPGSDASGAGATASSHGNQGSSDTPSSRAGQPDAPGTGRADAPSAPPQLDDDAPEEDAGPSRGATASATARSSHA